MLDIRILDRAEMKVGEVQEPHGHGRRRLVH
jgi:hypothetical protein